MTREEATEWAVKAFADRGVSDVGPLPVYDSYADVVFPLGGECHVRDFGKGNYIHFHVGWGAWDELSTDAPQVRIRHMIVNGEDIPESECYPC